MGELIGPGPASSLTQEFSLILPTMTASVFGPPPEALTTDLFANIPTTTPTPSITEACTACDGIMPGVLPTIPPQATTTAHTLVTPTQATMGGILTPGPTSSGEVWYRQPWTVPAAGLLCMYSLCSVITLAMLLFTGRLDLKMNWVHRSPRRRARDDLFDLWRVESIDHRASQRGRDRQLPAIPEHVQGSNASVAETEINYDDEQQTANVDRPDWYHAIEMQPYGGALVWSSNRESISPGERAGRRPLEPAEVRTTSRDYVRRMSMHSRREETGVVIQGEAEAVGRIRHILGDDRYEQQLRAWRLHELQTMQARMVQAGYF